MNNCICEDDPPVDYESTQKQCPKHGVHATVGQLIEVLETVAEALRDYQEHGYVDTLSIVQLADRLGEDL